MFYLEVWFWGFIIGLLLFILGVLFYDYDRSTTTNDTPIFVWILIGTGIVFLLVSLAVYILETPSPIQRCCKKADSTLLTSACVAV
jgi:heme A synthase